MTKQEFLTFISDQQKEGAVRFSLAFNSKGEIVIHWTNKEGSRPTAAATAGAGLGTYAGGMPVAA